MSENIITAIIAGVVGLTTGAIGSLVAPWMHWGIEKKRKKIERKMQLVKHWQEVLSEPTFNLVTFRDDSTFAILKPLLSKNALNTVERQLPIIKLTIISNIAPVDTERNMLMSEVARIEREWGLL